MRINDFAKCEEIVKFFAMDDELSREVALAQRLGEILRNGDSSECLAKLGILYVIRA